MRIEIKASATKHLITDEEIRTVVSYPEIRRQLVARIPGAVPFLHVGALAATEPHIEVIADLADPAVAIVFHAMMLRPATVTNANIAGLIVPRFAPQRA